MSTEVPQIDKLFKLDPYLRIHEHEIRRRYQGFDGLLSSIEKAEGKFVCLFSQ